jgi:hypothetical protein
VTISASSGPSARSASVTVTPGALSDLILSAGSVLGGSSTGFVLTLNGKAPPGGAVVALSSSSGSATVLPSSVTIPAGASTATFALATNPVAAVTKVQVTAAYGGVSKSASLTIQPPALAELSVKPGDVKGGASAAGTVRLSGKAPVGGFTISLVSSNPAVASVPASVTVPGGAVSANFAIATSPVSASSKVNIQATNAGATRSAPLVVTP